MPVYYKLIYANRSKELLSLRKTPLATVTCIEFLEDSHRNWDMEMCNSKYDMKEMLTILTPNYQCTEWRPNNNVITSPVGRYGGGGGHRVRPADLVRPGADSGLLEI